MTVRVRMRPNYENDLLRDRGIADLLGEQATRARDRVRVPWEGLEVSERHGVGPRGAFAQVTLTGPGAFAAEFGTRSRPPKAPLRNAIGGL